MAEKISLLASGTATTGANGNGFASDDYQTLTAQVSVTAASGTNPSLTVFIDVSCDGGTTWTQAAAGTALTTTGSQLISIGPGTANNASGLGNQVRVRYTITGTLPSFTFGVQAIFK